MICGILGEQTQEPVLSPKLGVVFERRHIVDYINSTGTDPISGDQLSVNDLITINQSPHTDPLPQTLIPNMLSAFQKQWDAVAVELFTLRKQLHTARLELSTALYQYDAAVKVALTAMRERDEAREALNQLAAGLGNQKLAQPATNGVEEPNHTDSAVASEIPTEVELEVNAAQQELFAYHKANKTKDAPVVDGSLSTKNVGAAPFKRCVLANVDSAHISAVIVGTALVFTNSLEEDGQHSKVAAKGTKAVALNASGKLAFALANSVVIEDTQVPFSGCTHLLFHPKIETLAIAASDDALAVLYERQVVAQFPQDSSDPVSALAIHGDGVLLAVATQGTVSVRSLAENLKTVATHKTPCPTITQVIFASNGYWMIVVSQDDEKSVVEVVDLRKNTVSHTITRESSIRGVAIDPSLQVVAIADDATISFERYIKKGKLWESVDQIITQSSILALGFAKMKLFSVTEDAKIQEYSVDKAPEDE